MLGNKMFSYLSTKQVLEHHFPVIIKQMQFIQGGMWTKRTTHSSMNWIMNHELLSLPARMKAYKAKCHSDK